MATINNPILLKIKGFVRNYCPGVMPWVLRFSARFLTMKREREYFLRRKRESKGKSPSLVLLSQPRAGTQVCEKVFKELYESTGGLSVNTGKFFFHYNASAGAKVSSVNWVNENIAVTGYFYGHLGPFGEVERLPKVNYVLMTRDPRDILVSHYYSVKEAHVINSQKMKEQVSKVQGMTLSEYCYYEPILLDLERYLDQAQFVRDSNLSHLYLRYEDLMHQPTQSLEKVTRFIGSEEGLIRKVVRENFQAQVESENLKSHRRSGKWGQFMEKLSSEDQQFLWERFGPKMVSLGYLREGLESVAD